MITTVTLNPAIDRTYFLDEWRLSQVNRVQRKNVMPGGKGINAAQIARVLGEQVTATGFLGAEAEPFFRQSLLAVGVIPDFVPVRGEIRQNITLIGPGIEQTAILEPGPEISHYELAALEEKVTSLAGQSLMVILSGSLPPGVPEGIYGRLIHMIREAGSDAILDTSGEPLRLGCEAGPILVKPKLAELEEAVGQPLETEQQWIDAGREVISWGAGMVLISLGMEESLLITSGEVLRIFCPKVQPVNTVGCGDALLAGVAVGLIRGMDLPDCVRWGMAAACVNSLCLGGGECDPRQVMKIYPNISVERIDGRRRKIR
ncbi:MAG TPA: 1-phosphofructokinase family hexose kinase [Bacillota bacterium]|nr:1-phosphofructokinase family hexose kinase [Bacillota bacterium]